MQEVIQNLFNFVHDNLGKDDAIIGLSGLERKAVAYYVTTPPEFKKTYLQNIENNYLLI